MSKDDTDENMTNLVKYMNAQEISYKILLN